MPDKKCHLPFTEKHTNTDTNSHRNRARQSNGQAVLWVWKHRYTTGKPSTSWEVLWNVSYLEATHIHRYHIWILYCGNNKLWCEVSPGDIFLSSDGPGQRWVSGRRQRGGAYRLTPAHVRAYVVILMWGVCWGDNILRFSHSITQGLYMYFYFNQIRFKLYLKTTASLPSVENYVIKYVLNKYVCCNYL